MLQKIKKYYIAYKRLKAIRLTRTLIESIPNKSLNQHRLHFYLYQLEREYREQTHIPYLTKTKENLKKKYPRITELLAKHFYLIILILYTLKGISILLFGYLLYAKQHPHKTRITTFSRTQLLYPNNLPQIYTFVKES